MRRAFHARWSARALGQAFVSSWRGPGTLVLVTHALTVRPLAGFLPEQAETVLLKPAPGSPWGASIIGMIAPPQ